MQFTLGKRQELQGFHPASQRVRDRGQRHQIGGTGQKKPTRPAVFIDALLDGQQQLGCALDLIDHRPVQTADHACRIALG